MEKDLANFSRRGGKLRLLWACIAIGVVWCFVLPWIANQPTMQSQLKFLDERGIDPSAMFYTELEAMDRILQESETR